MRDRMTGNCKTDAVRHLEANGIRPHQFPPGRRLARLVWIRDVDAAISQDVHLILLSCDLSHYQIWRVERGNAAGRSNIWRGVRSAAGQLVEGGGVEVCLVGRISGVVEG